MGHIHSVVLLLHFPPLKELKQKKKQLYDQEIQKHWPCHITVTITTASHPFPHPPHIHLPSL